MRILSSRGHPADAIVAIGSERSAGSSVPYGSGEVGVVALAPEVFVGCDVALFCASADVARSHAREAVERGCVVVDNSSAFRMDPATPLVVPEVNGELLEARPSPRVVANPNCSTILLLVALEPLRKRFGVERALVSTYQAVSGAGRPAIDELVEQTKGALDGGAPEPSVFPESCAFNVFTHESPVDPETGLNVEESKMIAEARRIWERQSASISPTCVRVPVERAHSQSVSVTLGAPASLEEVREAFDGAEGVEVVDDWGAGVFPTPLKASGRDEVLVGRLRPDPCEASDSTGRHRVFSLWLSGDQLRKGAALNAIQIADRLCMAPASAG